MPERTVVITGAASGIGRATAARLGAAGWRVIGIDLRDADVVADLSRADERARAIAEATALAAGTATAGAGHALGHRHLRRRRRDARPGWFAPVVGQLLRHRRTARGVAAPAGTGRRRRGHQLELDHRAAGASRAIWWRPAWPGTSEASARLADEHGSLATYPASKLAVAYWVRQQAVGPDWAGAGLRLNAVAPGMIDTPMVAGIRAHAETGPMLDMLPIPVGRPGRPEEIAALIEFLLGPDAAFFCGSVVFCDGGSDALLRTRDWPARLGHLAARLRRPPS